MKILYLGNSGKIDINGKCTRDMIIESGVRQSCIIAQFIFLFLVDYIIKSVVENKTEITQSFGNNLEDLEYIVGKYLCDRRKTATRYKIKLRN